MARIAIDARKLGDLGIGTYIEGIVRGLDRLDEQNDYVLLTLPGARLPKLVGGRIRTIPFASPKYSFQELVRLPSELRKMNAALLHSPHYVLPPRLRCPAIVTIHDLIHLRFPELLATPFHQLYARWMLRQATRNASLILTVSESSKRDIVEMLEVDPARIRTIANGVDSSFRPVTDDAALESVRRRYELPKRFGLCVGNINPHKNVLTLLDAWRLVTQHEDVDLVLVGESGRHDSKLKAIRAAIGAAPRVRHVPLVPHSELPSLYSLAEVFVIPSLYEGFGLTPLEAMACGTPVAAARTSSLPEVLGEDAVWFEPLDAPGMAEAITRLLNAPELRQELAERGLMRASRFSWDGAASQVLAAYQEVLGQNG